MCNHIACKEKGVGIYAVFCGSLGPCLSLCLCSCICISIRFLYVYLSLSLSLSLSLYLCGRELWSSPSGDLSRSFLWLCGSHQTGGSAYQEWQEVIAAIIGWGHWVTRWAMISKYNKNRNPEYLVFLLKFNSSSIISAQ